MRCVAEVRRLVASGDHDRALAFVQKALERLPDDPKLNELLGEQLALRKDTPGAMAAFEKGTKRWASTRSWEGLGICRQIYGDTEGAIKESTTCCLSGCQKRKGECMEADAYGIGYFLAGHYHILCREGEEYHFHIVTPHSDLKPEEMTYYAARKFIETHPVCANITTHEIRIMSYREIMDIIQGKSPKSVVKSLSISGEEEEEEALH